MEGEQLRGLEVHSGTERPEKQQDRNSQCPDFWAQFHFHQNQQQNLPSTSNLPYIQCSPVHHQKKNNPQIPGIIKSYTYRFVQVQFHFSP